MVTAITYHVPTEGLMDAQSEQLPRYVEVMVDIEDAPYGKNFAFGWAQIGGKPVKVFVGQRGHSEKNGDRWEKRPESQQHVPDEHDLVFAKVCTQPSPGKQPFAAFWLVQMTADERYDMEDAAGRDDDDDWDQGFVENDDNRCYFCGMRICLCSDYE